MSTRADTSGAQLIAGKPAVIAQKADCLQRRIGRNIRSARKTAGLTLKMAAERAGMHWRHWQKLEAGIINTSLSTLSRVGAALSIDTARLFDTASIEQPTALMNRGELAVITAELAPAAPGAPKLEPAMKAAQS